MKALLTPILAMFTRKKIPTPVLVGDWQSEIEKLTVSLALPKNMLQAVINVESAGNAQAVGYTGDFGLMQVTQGALTDYNRKNRTSYTIKDLFDPIVNVRVGAWYLRKMYDYHKDWSLAVRGYNGGYTVTNQNSVSLSYAVKVFKEIERLNAVTRSV